MKLLNFQVEIPTLKDLNSTIKVGLIKASNLCGNVSYFAKF
jgi:hypothetical protein